MGVCVINPRDLEDRLRCRSLEMHSVVHALDKLVRDHLYLHTLSNRARLKEMEGPSSQENESQMCCLDSSLGDATIQKVSLLCINTQNRTISLFACSHSLDTSKILELLQNQERRQALWLPHVHFKMFYFIMQYRIPWLSNHLPKYRSDS